MVKKGFFRRSWYVWVFLIILVITGLTYAFAPHSFHVDFGIDYGLEHSAHKFVGWLLLGVATIFFGLYLFFVRKNVL